MAFQGRRVPKFDGLGRPSYDSNFLSDSKRDSFMQLLPKFSIRQMLIAMVGVGFLSMCFAGAYRGDITTYGLTIGLAALIVPIVGLSVAYWSVYLIALISRLIVPVASQTERSGVTPDDPDHLFDEKLAQEDAN